MAPDDYQWHINSGKDNYHTLNLAFEQAEQIYKFEEDNRNYSEKHHFSTWEELDYELSGESCIRNNLPSSNKM